MSLCEKAVWWRAHAAERLKGVHVAVYAVSQQECSSHTPAAAVNDVGARLLINKLINDRQMRSSHVHSQPVSSYICLDSLNRVETGMIL